MRRRIGRKYTTARRRFITTSGGRTEPEYTTTAAKPMEKRCVYRRPSGWQLCRWLDGEVVRLAVGRERDIPPELGPDGVLQRTRRGWLAMRQKSLPWRRREACEPAEEFTAAGVSGKLPQLDDFRAHWNVFAVDAQRLRAFEQRAPPRALGLEAGQQHGIARIGQAARQMKQHAAAGGHAARGNDDAWGVDVADLLGFLSAASQMHFVGVQRIAARLFASELHVVVFAVPLVELGDADGHRAVNIDRQMRDALRVLQLA